MGQTTAIFLARRWPHVSRRNGFWAIFQSLLRNFAWRGWKYRASFGLFGSKRFGRKSENNKEVDIGSCYRKKNGYIIENCLMEDWMSFWKTLSANIRSWKVDALLFCVKGRIIPGFHPPSSSISGFDQSSWAGCPDILRQRRVLGPLWPPPRRVPCLLRWYDWHSGPLHK